MAVCYRHPSRETGVSCSSCGRPICTDCMTPTSVGMRCPECARDRTKVRTARSLSRVPSVTQTLIVVNVIVFLAETAAGAPLGGSGGGAWGAIFGIFGALIVVAYHRGIPIWQSGLGMVLLLNLLFSFTFSGISIGGHLGGLVGGLICGEAIVQWSERRRLPAVALGGCAAVALASVVGALAVAGSHGLTPNGL